MLRHAATMGIAAARRVGLIPPRRTLALARFRRRVLHGDARIVWRRNGEQPARSVAKGRFDFLPLVPNLSFIVILCRFLQHR